MLAGQIREHVRGELQAEFQKRVAETAEAKYGGQMRVLEAEVSAKEASLKEFRAKEAEVLKRSMELEAQREGMELEVQRKLREAREEIRREVEAQAAERAGEVFGAQVRELEERLREREASVRELRESEVELRKRQRELEGAREAMELEVQRKLDEERGLIRTEVEVRATETHRRKEQEQEKVINDLKRSLDEMQRKAEQGSTETQGEVLELDFEQQVRAVFPHDGIAPVPKGIRGADIVQGVRTGLGQECGVLLWEIKNTKNWSDKWIAKLKDDMIETRASIGLLVSVVLPEGLQRFGQIEGVWVSDPLCALPLAAALRQQLLALERERRASAGKGEKMEMLYAYLAGTEFRQKIEGIVDAFTTMQDQLNRERRAMEREWDKREKQIKLVVKNTVGLYGDMQGIIGGEIPDIPALELGGQARSLPEGELELGE